MSLALFTPRLFPPPSAVRRWHQRRTARSDLLLAASIADLDSAAWDRLSAPAGLFMSRRYLRLLEDTRPANMEPRYALVFHGRQPVAAVAAQRIEVDAGCALRTDRRRSVNSSGPRIRLLLCGNVFSWGPHGVALAPGHEPTALWRAAIGALETIDETEERRADVLLVKDFAGPDSVSLETEGFRTRATEPDMVLDLPPAWTTGADYLASLKTRYRRAALRVARRVEEAGCRVEPLAHLEPHAERLHDLYLQVHGAARIALATAPAAYLPGLAALCRDGLRCTVVRRDDEIVGFVTTLRVGDTAVGYHLGFDRRLGAGVPLYPRLLQAALGDALALGCRRLSLGRTALDSKARLGACPRPLHVCWRGRGLLGRGLGKVVDRRPDEAPVRRPFRTGT